MKEHEEKKQWVLCPWCGSKTRLQIFRETELKDFPLFCQGLCRGRKALPGTRRLRCRHGANRNANGQHAEKVGDLC